jgi:diguanylate cyclase (GGDEF)-like protein/PAS domain S-box-containing protein
VLLGAAYFGAAKGGLALSYAHGQVTAVWPPSGIALAAVFLWGYRAWPGIMVGAFLANLSTGAPVPVDVGIALGNTGEALMGALLLRRAGFRPSLARIRDIAAVALLAAGASTLISATVGTTSLWLGGLVRFRDFGSVWRVWWLGDAGGDLLVAPLLMLIAARGFAGRLSRGRRVEAGAVAAVLVGASLLVLSRPGHVYLIFPALIWAALRFRQPGATLGSITIAGLAVWFTAHRVGPFVGPSPDDSLLLSQSFVGVVHMTALCLAAVTAMRDAAERAVREGDARKGAMLNAALDAVITADHAGRIIEFNQAAERTFGYAPEAVRGHEVAELIVPARLRDAYRRTLARYLATGERRTADRRIETVAMRADGSEFPVELSVTRIDLDGPPLFTAFVRDITERKNAEERLTFLAEHDPLTGLVNRRRFEEELVRQIALSDRYASGGALLVMDVDNLKRINDAFGHAAGDRLLRSVAEAARRQLRSSDILARLGGDEFVALLPSVGEREAIVAAEHLVDAVRGTVIRQDGQQFHATVSVGVAAITSGSTPEVLLINADRAMYRAKQLGRDQVIGRAAVELGRADKSPTA